MVLVALVYLSTDTMDYTPLTQTLTFAVGDMRQCFNISITDDDTDEPVEMFFVNLMSTEADVTVPQATVSIMDNGMLHSGSCMDSITKLYFPSHHRSARDRV